MRVLITLVSTVILTLVLAVQYPDRMIKPGALSSGHQALNRDCLGCHILMQGASEAGCIRCHEPSRIGRWTTTGALLPAAEAHRVQFHAGLAGTSCMACHTLHAGQRHRRDVKFRHDLLAPAVREGCISCHETRRPADALHQRVSAGCASCHTTETWRSASFDHRGLLAGVACASCHQQDQPQDVLHRQVNDACGSCHATTGWKPATFDHARYFRFDPNHPADCRTCHAESRPFTEYTCYGCHEHSPARIAAEHREEGIRVFDDCARCHRSGREEDAEHGGGHEGGGEEGEDGD